MKSEDLKDYMKDQGIQKVELKDDHVIETRGCTHCPCKGMPEKDCCYCAIRNNQEITWSLS